MVVIVKIISATNAGFGLILISMNEARGMVVQQIVHFDVGRKTRRRSSSFGIKELMVPHYLAGLRMHRFPRRHLDKMRMT